MVDHITAPYNFVPLSNDDPVIFPNWADRIHMSIPMENALCGRINFRIETLSPLLIGGERKEGHVHMPERDGKPFIPGSSLRGLLRSVIEIVAFGKFGPVNSPDKYSKNVQSDHRSPRMDLADCLFGCAKTSDGAASLRGRVMVSAITFDETTDALLDKEKALILLGPDPDCYRNYVQQTDLNPRGNSGKTEEYQRWNDNKAMPRGWKRYPLQPYREPPSKSGRMATHIHPLKQGLTATGTLVFHNVRPEEAGAVLWALTLGLNEELCHNIGMAKAFGYGQFRAQIDDDQFLTQILDDQQKTPATLVEDFKGYMSDQVEEWENHDRLRMLRGMTSIAHGDKYKELYLKMPRYSEQEFTDIKKKKLFLRAYPLSKKIERH